MWSVILHVLSLVQSSFYVVFWFLLVCLFVCFCSSEAQTQGLVHTRQELYH